MKRIILLILASSNIAYANCTLNDLANDLVSFDELYAISDACLKRLNQEFELTSRAGSTVNTIGSNKLFTLHGTNKIEGKSISLIAECNNETGKLVPLIFSFLGPNISIGVGGGKLIDPLNCELVSK